MVVVLPSRFTGGATQLSYSGITSQQDCSGNSVFQTSVLSWYSDVTQEVKAITSGYQLMLSYSIRCTDTTVPLPSLSANREALQRLRDGE